MRTEVSSATSPPAARGLAVAVGGICRGSPTMTAERPRPMAPTAAATRIWDASSKTTMSTYRRRAGRKWAIESGEARMQGVSAVTRSP